MYFSIIIPSYNHSHCLKRCISSITNQKFYDYEIIVVDDGSMDDTKDIVCNIQKEFSEIYIKYIRQENFGVSCARNHGVRESSGQYIWFLDADDYLLNESMSVLNQYIEKHRAVDMLLGGYAAIYKDRVINKFPSELSSNRHKNFENFIKRKMRGLTIGATVINKALFEKYSFPENIHVGEDYVLFAKIFAYSNKCFSIQEIIVNKSRHSETSLRNDHYRGAISQINCIAALFDDPNIDVNLLKFKNYYTATKLLPASRSYFYLEDYRSSLKCYLSAILKYPLAIFRTKYLTIFLKSVFKLIYIKFI